MYRGGPEAHVARREGGAEEVTGAPRARRSSRFGKSPLAATAMLSIAHLRLPISHRRAIRTTNLLERLFGEERRRTKVIPHAFGERAVLKLMFAALLRAGKTWQRVVINEFELRQIEDLRNELDEEFKQRSTSTVTTASRRRIYSKEGT